MTSNMLILVLLIITALAFDFTNGFHDTGNSMATSIATGAFKPKTAVKVAGILNLVGAFLSVKVVLTVTNKVINIQDSEGNFEPGITSKKALLIIFAGLVGGVIWNLVTWLYGLPSSSSHALFGGLIGAGLIGIGVSGVNWEGIVSKIILPAVVSPFIAGLISATGTHLVYKITDKIPKKEKNQGFRLGQAVTATLVSLAHGTGDAQKTMGVIALALIADDRLTTHSIEQNGLPLWIIIASSFTIACGTYLGGWRIIRTLGQGIVEIAPPQGMATESASASIILTSSHAGMALSTTQVTTGSILGSGIGKPKAKVRWEVVGRMVTAWLITLPTAALVGMLCYALAAILGGAAGAVLDFILLLLAGTAIYLVSRRSRVSPQNVNDNWEEKTSSPKSKKKKAR